MNNKPYRNMFLGIVIASFSFLLALYFILNYILPEFLSASSGQVATLLSTGIYMAAILTGLRSIVLRNTRYSRTSVRFFIVLLLYMISGSLVSVFFASGNFSRWTFVFIALPIHYLVVASYAHEEIMAERLMVGVITFGALVSILLTFSDASGNFPSLAGVIRHRGAVYFLGRLQGPVTLASISGLTFTCAIIFMAGAKKWISTLFFFFLPFLVTALLFSGGRMALISVFLTLIIIWFLRKREKSKHQSMKFLTIIARGATLISIIGLVVWFTSQYNYAAIERIANIPSIALDFEADRSISERIGLWSLALLTLKKNPLGIGVDKFFVLYGLSTHNEFLNIAVGAGILGITVFTLLGAMLYYRCYLGSRYNITDTRKSLALTALGGGIFTFFISFTEAWSYSNTFLSIMIWTILAIGVSVSRDLDKT